MYDTIIDDMNINIEGKLEEKSEGETKGRNST